MIQKVIKHFKRMLKTKTRKLFNIKRIQLHGVWIDLTHKNIPSELKTFFYNESYESEEIGILSKNLFNDDVVMEIGAGIGFLSTYCAKRIGSDNVFAYEANPYMIDKINETYKLNCVKPKLKNTLFSNKEEKKIFYLEKNFWSSSTVGRSDDAEIIEIDSSDINKEIDLIQPTLLIIDIEGGEKDLIPLIDFKQNNIKKIILEIHPHVIGEYNSSKIIETIINHKFSMNFNDSKSCVFMFERCI